MLEHPFPAILPMTRQIALCTLSIGSKRAAPTTLRQALMAANSSIAGDDGTPDSVLRL
jgi:hypothetical protein